MRRTSLIRHLFPAAVASVLFSGVFALGQVNLGNFRGIVTDPSGAAVPDATVTALKNDQGLSRTTKSLVDGSWELPSLLSGTYTITVEKGGFKKYSDNHLILYPQDMRRVDVKLEVGATTQTVQVSAQAPVVSTDQTAITAALPQTLQEFRAGVRSTGGPEFELRMVGGGGHFSSRGGFQWVIHGSEGNETRASMDGVEQTNLGNFRTNQYMIKEEKLTMVDAPAEFQVSGTMQSVSRGGTNEIRGMFLVQVNNSDLNGLGPNHTTRGPGVSLLQYEGDVGGPLFLPKVYDGRNKTFWHFTTFQQRGGSSSLTNFIYPSIEMRQGNLSAYTAQIHDVDGVTPFPGNQIPANRISPIAASLLKQYVPVPAAGSSGLALDYSATNIVSNAAKNYQFRVDQKIANSNTVSVVYYNLGNPSSQPFDVNPNDGPLTATYGANAISVQDTHIFGPHIVNEAIFTRSNTFSDTKQGSITGQAFLQSIGIPTSALGGFTPPNSVGAPSFVVPGFGANANFGPLVGRGQGLSQSFDVRYTFKDNLSYNRGKHLFKGGFAWGRYSPSSYSVSQGGGAWGVYNFNGFATGNAFADFLLGIPNSTSITGVRGLADLLGNEIGGYLQDEYKVTSRLTVNVGVRYQTFTPEIDTTGKFYNFDFQKMSVVIPDNSKQYVVPAYPSAIPIVTASQNNYPDNLMPNPSFGGFEPRIGLAWRPWDNKTVIRAGYGLYHVPEFAYSGGTTLRYGPNTTGPFQLSEGFPTNTITGGIPSQTLGFVNPANPTAAPLITPFPSAAGTIGAQSVTAYPPGMKMAYTQQWNATVERDLGAGVGLRVSYVGSTGRQMPYLTNMQTIYPPSTTPFSNARKPFQPTSLWATINVARNGGNMDYNALEVEVHRKFSKGLFLMSEFNWNKTLRDIYYAGAPDYPFDRRRDRGTDDQTEPILWVTNVVYPVPLGRGQRYLNLGDGLGNSVLNHIVNGWTTSFVVTFNAGYTWTALYSGFDGTGTGITSGRADKVCSKPMFQRDSTHWWDPSCFRIPSVDGTANALTSTGATNLLGRFGNGPYGDLRGPGWMIWEMGLYKDFHLAPVWKDRSPILRFRASTRNLFNHPTQGGLFGCNETITSGNFGYCPKGSEPWFVEPYRVIELVGQIIF